MSLHANARHGERRSIEVDFYFDIETEEWDTFVVGAIDSNVNGFKFYTDENEFVAAILREKGVGWAHNGGRYDTLLVLEHMLDIRGVRVFSAGQRVICVKTKELEIRDSAALIPLPLSLASEIGGYRKRGTGLPCICGARSYDEIRDALRFLPSQLRVHILNQSGCGGYCSIKRDMPREQFNLLCEYLRADCKAGKMMLAALVEFAEEHDLDLGATIGSSAWRNVMRFADLEPADWSNGRSAPSTLYDFARLAYGGGRTQAFRPHMDRAYSFDINSAYPAALTQINLPDGEREEVFGALARRAFTSGKPGLFQARVHVDADTFIPPLMMKTGDRRCCYPTGTFVGHWTALELQYAESVGVEILDVMRGIVWSKQAPLLKAWCEKLWALRDKVGPKSALGTWLKLYLNSLTGKLAQHPDREECIINPDEKFRLCPRSGPCMGILCGSSSVGCCPHRCIGACGRAVPIDKKHRIWTKKVYRLADCAHVHYSAYLTGSTRMTLHRMLSFAGWEHAGYTDTDNIVCTVDLRDHFPDEIGPKLGQWKFERVYRPFDVLAPKTYAGTDEETGEYIAKSKGIPDAPYHFDHIGGRFGGVMIDRGVNTFRTAVRSGGSLFTRKKMFRGVNADGVHFGDRVLRDDGRTYPQDYGAFKPLELPT